LRTRQPELPLHLLRSRRRSGAYVMMLLLGTAMFAVFFFLTIYIQTVWGYSPVRSGIAWLPFPAVIIVVSLIVARFLLTRFGVRPLLMAGPLLASAGFVWLSRLSEHGHYLTNLLAPMLITSAGLGLMFVPLTLMVVSHVKDEDTGAASGLFNIGQQIGGSIGLAAIGTIAWTSVARNIHGQFASGAASASGGVTPAVYAHALTHGFSIGLLVAAGVVLVGFFAAIVTTWTPGRVRISSAVREDGVEPCDEVLGTCDIVPEGAAS
jgi:predicted MFS family arabinose efflux permease